MLNTSETPVLGFAAYSGTGKTTLLTAILPLFKKAGLRIGVIKHSHHHFQIDQPGKDSYRIRKAGAEQILLAARTRTALIIENSEATQEPIFADQLKRLDSNQLDLILVEGFKREAIPKIEIYRTGLGHPYLYAEDPNIIALVTDTAPQLQLQIPVLDINLPEQVTDFILNSWLPNASV